MTEASAPMPRFYSLWSINGPLNEVRLCSQLDRLRSAGLDGVVFHPRFYPGSPPYLSQPYFDQVSKAILHARSIGLAFWLYDENGWPSGAVGGRLLEQYPGLAQRWVGLYQGRTEGCIAEFKHGDNSWCLAERTGGGVDYLNPEMCRRFIEMTYEGYRRGLSPEAFESVEAFFCDEPEFGLGHIHHSLPPDGAIPWTPGMPQLYRARYGEDLMPLLPSLFFALEGHEQARVRFYELLNDLFCEGFISPLNDWCLSHGKRFTAHVKGEEHPLFQVPMAGSCHPVFRRLSLPGIDALGRHPSNDYFPRQVSSAARQFGDGRCMAEAFGGAGWGASPEDLETYLLWLGKHGLTDFVMHLSQYRLDSAAIRDWPPSEPLHITWSKVYPGVLDRVRRELRPAGRPPADTLIVAPYRGIMAAYAPRELTLTNIHDAGTYPASAAGEMNDRFLRLIAALHAEEVNYDVIDERTLEEYGSSGEGGIRVGNSVYGRVIPGDGCRLGLDVSRHAVQFVNRSDGPALAERPGVNRAETGGIKTNPIRWRLDVPPANSLLLESESEDGLWFTSGFVTDTLSSMRTTLRFADDIAEVYLNGTSLPPEPLDDGTSVTAPSEILRGCNTLRFRARQALEKPFIWLDGAFRVTSRTPFTACSGEVVRTEGPFVIHSGGDALEHDLVLDGFPFMRESLIAAAEAEFPRATEIVALDGMAGDAVRLIVDGRDLGWSWRRNGRFEFAGKLGAGKHRLRIELIPNAYNCFGPHHYYNGDWFVISPDQMKGVRNFADSLDAPAFTHISAWHFRRFKLPATLSLGGEQSETIH